MQTEPPRHDARKIVTVLFCDLVGSTAMGEGLDPETTLVVIASYYAVFREDLESHGGAVEKMNGRAVLTSRSISWAEAQT